MDLARSSKTRIGSWTPPPSTGLYCIITQCDSLGRKVNACMYHATISRTWSRENIYCVLYHGSKGILQQSCTAFLPQKYLILQFVSLFMIYSFTNSNKTWHNVAVVIIIALFRSDYVRKDIGQHTYSCLETWRTQCLRYLYFKIL